MACGWLEMNALTLHNYILGKKKKKAGMCFVPLRTGFWILSIHFIAGWIFKDCFSCVKSNHIILFIPKDIQHKQVLVQRREKLSLCWMSLTLDTYKLYPVCFHRKFNAKSSVTDNWQLWNCLSVFIMMVFLPILIVLLLPKTQIIHLCNGVQIYILLWT